MRISRPRTRARAKSSRVISQGWNLHSVKVRILPPSCAHFEA